MFLSRFFWLLGVILFGSSVMAASTASSTHTALFAGGCFWCMQPAFDQMAGVIRTRVGYAGGEANTATYEQVSSGTTGHVEVIQVEYDASKVAYETLLSTYLENIDPTDAEGQFADKGSQYRTAVYYADASQKLAAEKGLATIAPKFAPVPIRVLVLPATEFYAAEEYHQHYYRKNSVHYNAYKHGSGRAGYIEKVWGKP